MTGLFIPDSPPNDDDAKMDSKDILDEIDESNHPDEQPTAQPNNLDAGDPVIKSYNIHITSRLSPFLYLLQYPTRNAQRPYPNPISTKYKPKTKILQLEIPIDTTHHYDSEKAEKFQGDGEHGKFDRFRIEGNMTSGKAGYAVGVIRGDKLHLTPLSGTAILRPTFDYLTPPKEPKKDELKTPGQAKAIQISAKSSTQQDPSPLLILRVAEEEEWQRLE
ncbi:DNA-directed RNA polymerase III subunit rpc5 [Neolecta irregularis DAH-3]|uniref:DNA-directed RNA polymerase III subunit rpc5 n=1 Tax=Neolecta irregularis (strain DAH-3) TaxID=1198029 RepID=A0A1U7LHI3_NEOID|nr:DNA-directed RNA polymerase III subunit rpc5 [Neolecta irregularis DAH-3]|eukprot:OLL22053.1 DNA-directed RNA polymerase III subunit rpc5 [Neolecta irregularis DAH-3]